MNQQLRLVLNGKERPVEALTSPSPLASVLQHLALREDRIAVELNGELAPRTGWSDQLVHSGDRLEIVHFVGGGSVSCSLRPLWHLAENSSPKLR